MKKQRWKVGGRAALASAVFIFGGWLHGVAKGEWLNLGPAGGYSVGSLALQPGYPQIIYASTYPGGIFKSLNGGLDWAASNTGLSTLNVTDVVINPTAPLTVYVGTQSAGVFKSTDGAATWSSVNTGLEGLKPAGYVPHLVMDGAGLAVYAGTPQGVFKTTDGGITWAAASNGLTEPNILSLAVDPRSPLTLYAGTRVGIFKTVDGGGAWTAIYSQQYHGVIALQVAPTAISTIFAGTLYMGPSPGGVFTGFGVLKSTDGGVTWASANDAQLSSRVVSAIAIDPRAASTVYAGVWGQGAATAFRSTDGGATWVALAGGLTTTVNTLLVDSQGTVYSGAGGQDYAGGVFKLVENGDACTANAITLCLNAARFRVQAVWQVPSQGTSGVGQAVPMTSDTGYFWFFSANNVELVVKVVDGRAFNNKFWVFYGALSDVQYTITITDTVTGTVKTYTNPQRHLASVADTAAF